MGARYGSLLRSAGRMKFDTLIAFRPENISYMTGFWGEAAAVLQRGQKPVIVSPELEAARAESESGGCEVVVAERGMRGIASTAARVARAGRRDGAGAGGGGACTDCRDYRTMTYLKRAVPKIIQTEEPFDASRMVKDPSEIAVLRRASRIIDGLFEVCSQRMRAGQRESELQAVLMAEAAAHDAFDVGYASTLNPLIIAGGPNGALPHAQVSQRKFRRGDMVVVDLTLRYRGYVSDATRTFAVGRPASKEAQNVYDIVRESQRLGLAAARAGAACGSVDVVCRSYIEQQGYGRYFVHSTGHGIGLEVHELPAVSRNIATRLRRGMAITVEPGIYLPGRFGVRIEDSLVIRGPGQAPGVLHRFTKDLVTV